MAVSVAYLQACDSFCIHLGERGRGEGQRGREEGREGERGQERGGRGEEGQEVITKAHTNIPRHHTLGVVVTEVRGQVHTPHPSLSPHRVSGSECRPRHHSVWNGSMGTWNGTHISICSEVSAWK